MSQPVQISSQAQFDRLLKSSRIVVTDFYADWCGPCKVVAPVFEQLAQSLSRPNQITFTKVNTDTQKEIASKYNITTLPTFLVFKQGQVVEKAGSDPRKLKEVVKNLAIEAERGSGSGPSGFAGAGNGDDWYVGSLPRGYDDVTDQVESKGLELLNADGDFGGVKVLFGGGKPSGLKPGKAAEGTAPDWVESDTDEQLMLFVPFQATLKVHTLQITSLPPTSEEDEVPMRPKTIQVYINRSHILGFDEAEGITATQSITISEKDWDSTGTATIPLRFVKFQNVASLVLFIVDGDGEGEKVRVDRLRIIGETGEKRDLGKLEKIGDHPGE